MKIVIEGNENPLIVPDCEAIIAYNNEQEKIFRQWYVEDFSQRRRSTEKIEALEKQIKNL
jgi:hypothetical protein